MPPASTNLKRESLSCLLLRRTWQVKGVRQRQGDMTDQAWQPPSPPQSKPALLKPNKSPHRATGWSRGSGRQKVAQQGGTPHHHLQPPSKQPGLPPSRNQGGGKQATLPGACVLLCLCPPPRTRGRGGVQQEQGGVEECCSPLCLPWLQTFSLAGHAAAGCCSSRCRAAKKTGSSCDFWNPSSSSSSSTPPRQGRPQGGFSALAPLGGWLSSLPSTSLLLLHRHFSPTVPWGFSFHSDRQTLPACPPASPPTHCHSHLYLGFSLFWTHLGDVYKSSKVAFPPSFTLQH